MKKTKVIKLLKSLKGYRYIKGYDNHLIDFGYNKAIDTACSIIEAYL